MRYILKKEIIKNIIMDPNNLSIFYIAFSLNGLK